MKIIPPYQITSEILNVINEANDFLILVSPYVNFTNWERIKIDLKNAISRNVKIVFYTRLDAENFKSWEQIEQLGIKPSFIKNLHAKLYYNENSGIVTSMNLLTSSNLNAIEFGTLMDKKEEIEELKIYVKKYLEPNAVEDKPNEDDLYLSKEKFKIVLQNILSEEFNKNIYCKNENGGIIFNASNSFFVCIDITRNNLNLSAVISQREADNFNSFILASGLNKDEISLNIGRENTYSSIVYSSKKSYTNMNLDYLNINEKKEIIDIIMNFVLETLQFKKSTYEKIKAEI